MSDFYGPFDKEVKSKDKLAKATNLGAADAKYKCPKCGASPMEIKLGRGGKFLSCSRYPDCDGALSLDGMEYKKDVALGVDPASGLPIFVLNGRFGPYVQLGVKLPKPAKRKKGDPIAPRPVKPRMASIPKTMDPSKVTIAEALKYLSLPRALGIDPKTGKTVTASIGRFGPYVVSDGDFRSVKPPDDVYDMTLERALELLAIAKKPRGFRKEKRVE